MIASGSAVPSTPIDLVSRLTAQAFTPGTWFTAFSTRALQAAQLMPVTIYCFITDTSFHQFLQSCHQFIDNLVIAAAELIRNTSMDMAGK